ncbi:unnamed protein product [Schistosoma margrebowiei]|uniref:Threonylcarbamoyl-AMP synthase n=1 Tax=Schistosoma margrebowiei TaxID=48269 RepID=A0A183MXE6_9TREM|nr:unnamed protein product [Schistosoma margrebowiei]
MQSHASLNLNAIVQLISQNDGVIALPTDTIYGLACSVFNSEAIERIRRIKGRSETKPMAICLDQVSHISHWCDTKNIPTGLLSDLLPGPVTVLLPRFSDRLQDPLSTHLLNPSDKRVGIRIPDSGFIRKLISALNEQTRFSSIIGNNVEHSSGCDKHDNTSIGGGHPLVLTSANLSGQPSAIQIEVSHISHWCDTKNIPTGLLSDLLPGPVTVLLPRFSDRLQDPLSTHLLNPSDKRVGYQYWWWSSISVNLSKFKWTTVGDSNRGMNYYSVYTFIFEKLEESNHSHN